MNTIIKFLIGMYVFFQVSTKPMVMDYNQENGFFKKIKEFYQKSRINSLEIKKDNEQEYSCICNVVYGFGRSLLIRMYHDFCNNDITKDIFRLDNIDNVIKLISYGHNRMCEESDQAMVMTLFKLDFKYYQSYFKNHCNEKNDIFCMEKIFMNVPSQALSRFYSKKSKEIEEFMEEKEDSTCDQLYNLFETFLREEKAEKEEKEVLLKIGNMFSSFYKYIYNLLKHISDFDNGEWKILHTITFEDKGPMIILGETKVRDK